ncbi:MAG: discoidin domain-containing protein [Lachnospiraceae bacterium]|nr:discoidin domain-containing protein [Lachnospiraceae bacterium]
MRIELQDKNGTCLCSAKGETSVHLRAERTYEPGDRILVEAEPGSFLTIKLEEAVAAAHVYAKEDRFVFPIPFGEEREPYAKGTWEGTYHLYTVTLQENMGEGTRNLSTNPLDVRGATGFYPHCTASVETRGESIFAARNTIDGYEETDCHGEWPFTSWGDNEDPNAEIQIDFGRPVRVDQVVIRLRSDFPHDNYWKEACLTLEDGSQYPVELKKTGLPQSFDLGGTVSSWVKLGRLIKDETLESPFPALTFWKVMGRENN